MTITRTATQTCNATHPITRVNATRLVIYKLRNNTDLEACIDEVSAVLDTQTLVELRRIATRHLYGFICYICCAELKRCVHSTC